MADFVLTLGDFAFTDKEVPEKIAVGGVQQLATKQLIGGIRVVDAMGAIEDDIEWTGWLLGANASSRRDFLKAYRLAGTVLTLTWADLRYQVIVQQFSAEFQRKYQYLYRISLKVVADLTNAAAALSTTALGLDDVINVDLGSANDLSGSIGDSQLTSLMSSVSKAVSAVSTFSGAAPSVLNSVLQPLAAVTQRVALLQATGDISIGSALGFSGVLAGGNGENMAMTFSTQLSAVQQLASLSNLSGLLGRMTRNLSSAGSSDNTVTVAGGNLFAIAATRYGDAKDWTAIAQANGLADPFISGTQDLIIPAVPDDVDGVLAS